jgi:hypothetical protein
MLNLVSSSGLSKCGTLFPSLSLMNSPQDVNYFSKSTWDPFYSGIFDRYEVPLFALIVYPEFEVPNICHT